MRGFFALPQLLADGSRSMVDCVTEGEHIDLGASSTVAGPVACKIGDVSRSSRKVNRPNRGGVAKRSGCVDIAILQSAHDKEGVKDFVAEYGK